MLIRNHAGDLLAVINISGPTSRLIARIDQAAHRLRATATALESTLAQPRPPGAAPRG
ncbi:hypothetical protein JHE00_17005 [Prauserella sp. ASG 168]|uniref:Uncharacterized protein n=1 Tax=Prauserella cavernicola TaxID=2800127 RepID=A0A934QTF0_9PSEU|nr:hypothetical protein [Prauserella cavernicola]